MGGWPRRHRVVILSPTFFNRDCIASDDDSCRYYLSRRLDLVKPTWTRIIYLMLNPSKARGRTVGDPTQRKVEGFTERLGGASYGIVNLFAKSETYPEDLFKHGYGQAVGAFNDLILARVFYNSYLHQWPIVCAWGNPTKIAAKDRNDFQRRVRQVVASAAPNPLYCLDSGESGYPRHPLMLGYNAVYGENGGVRLRPWPVYP